MLKKSQLELLAPAGDLEKAKVALAYGADAIYCGLPAFSLRARENAFSFADLKTARALTKKAGAKLYVTTNIFPRTNQFALLEKHLCALKKIQPDAVIFSDLGVFRLLRKILPRTPLHLSVQANTVNAESARFWFESFESGVARIILARELSLKEIVAIHRVVPKLELETFVHGAICMSYSGRCLLSLYLTNRDGNRGVCSQVCRWKYDLKNSKFQIPNSRKFPISNSQFPNKSEILNSKQIPNTKYQILNTDFVLEEEKRPGEYFSIEEDAHGSYILNSKDLCLIEYLGALAKAGVTSFKIEGRLKSVGYLATVTRAYRHALDDLKAGKKFDRKLFHELHTISNREYTLGFFDGSQKDLQNYERSAGENRHSFLGMVEQVRNLNSNDKAQMPNQIQNLNLKLRKRLSRQIVFPDNTNIFHQYQILFAPRNRFTLGEKIEIVTPGEIFSTQIRKFYDEKNQPITLAHGGQSGKVWLEIPHAVPVRSIIRKKE